MKISEMKIPEHITLCEFESREALTDSLCELIKTRIQNSLNQSGRASIAVSGGSTPIPLFRQLSQAPLDWSAVTITLADDRWVSPDHQDSNERLVKENLLQNQASASRFIGLWQENISAKEAEASCNQRLAELDDPLNTVILGMGNDGHTASLFPCAKADLRAALASNKDCAATHPASAPHARMTLTPKRLFNSDLRILHICGQDKLDVLKKALKENDLQTMPISIFLQRPLTIYWAP